VSETVVASESPIEGLAVITLNDPQRGNFCSWGAVEQMANALEAAREAGSRVVILASGLEGHWLEHAWLTDLEAGFAGRETTGSAKSWFKCIKELNKTDVVSIAAISGDTSGGGCELGWACDLRIADERAVFIQPEVVLGVGAAIGGVSRLRTIIGRAATAELVLLARPMTASRMYELGGVNRVVPAGNALEEAISWATHLLEQPPEALAAHKRMLSEGDAIASIDEMLRNDSRIALGLGDGALASGRLAEFQEKFDNGATPRIAYGS
jgi:enoyl-CoA hydratase/carnithine racemase